MSLACLSADIKFQALLYFFPYLIAQPFGREHLGIWAEGEYPGRVAARFAMDHELAHKMYAGADFFLMPSRYEPCGLNQMYSLHYGTLPIAHETGGLKDTIVDITSDKVNGQGFLFNDMNPEEMEKAVDRAVDFYNSAPKKEIEEARKRGMMEDFTWVKSASLYNDLYNSIAN